MIVYSVRTDEIIFIESTKRELTVYTTKEKLVIPYMTCKQIMKDLNPDDFIQCNRNTVINKGYVERIDFINRYIKLRGIENEVEIGSSMKKRIKDEFSN